MGLSSEWAIEEANFLYETDEDYRRAYDEQMQIDAAEEAEFFERERELEMLDEHFDDKLIDVFGEVIEVPETEAVLLVDDDLPF